MKRVLVIKNEKSLSPKIVSGLKQEGCFTITLHNENKGLNIVFEQNWDFIILDWDSFSMPGPEICQKIKAIKTTPIIIVTNRLSSKDCIAGLSSGADDYIRKPFEQEELVARIKAILRRHKTNLATDLNSFEYKDILIDEFSKVVTKSGDILHLTEREYDLLVTLIKNKNMILSREMLLNQVWGHDVVVNPNVVDLYIGYLRKKLKCHKKNRYIQTVHGRGYSLIDCKPEP